MKRLRKKSGFTLVECVVAMAILAVMTLLLAMMLKVTIDLRNQNRKIEDDVDNQVEYLVNEQSTVAESIPNADIKFDDDTIIKGDNPNKIYIDDSDSDARLWKVDYGIDPGEAGSPSTQPPVTQPGQTLPPTADSSNGKKVYGAVDCTQVTITETEKTEASADTYKVKWTFSFTPQNTSYILSVKAAFPTGTSLLDYSVSTNNCDVHYLANRVVRMMPTTNNSNVTVDINFEISKKNYDDNIGNVAKYFTGSGNANTASVYLNT